MRIVNALPTHPPHIPEGEVVLNEADGQLYRRDPATGSVAAVTPAALPAAAALDGTEAVPVVQDGATVRTTAQAIADLGGGGGGGGEELLATGGFDLNSVLSQTLYAVPAGKVAFITRLVLAHPTDVFTSTTAGPLSLRDATESVNTGTVALESFDDSSSYVVLSVSTAGKSYAAGAAVRARLGAPAGDVNTCTFHVFGFLVDA